MLSWSLRAQDDIQLPRQQRHSLSHARILSCSGIQAGTYACLYSTSCMLCSVLTIYSTVALGQKAVRHVTDRHLTERTLDLTDNTENGRFFFNTCVAARNALEPIYNYERYQQLRLSYMEPAVYCCPRHFLLLAAAKLVTNALTTGYYSLTFSKCLVQVVQNQKRTDEDKTLNIKIPF